MLLSIAGQALYSPDQVKAAMDAVSVARFLVRPSPNHRLNTQWLVGKSAGEYLECFENIDIADSIATITISPLASAIQLIEGK